jgi:hypothetical protein
MSDYMLDQYEEYLEDFRAWGHEYQAKPLSYGQFERLKVEQEDIDIAAECDHLSKKRRQRREQIERLLLTHESCFTNGPRVMVSRGKPD